MDYKTFVAANSDNRRTIDHLINLVKNRVDHNSNFALLLGAGASVTSGVKSASNMIDEWKKKRFASENPKISILEWEPQQDWYNSDEQYSRLFELVYDQPSQRRAYIEKAVSSAKPSWGYAYLVSLISEGYFNIIFTTNFDDLINEACYIYSENLRPLVCAHDSAVSSVRLTSDRPKVIKLHGDFLYDSIKNTASELQNLENNMRDKFVEFARELGLIVIGYSGNDQSIMDLLAVLARSPNYFRNGIYWCIQKNSTLSKRLTQLLRNDRVFWLEIDGFDELMCELACSAKVDLPQGVTKPHLTAFNRTKHLVEKEMNFSSPDLSMAINVTKELYKKVGDALNKVGFEIKTRPENNFKSAIGGIEEVLSKLKISVLTSEKNYEEAIQKLRELLKQPDMLRDDSAWTMLIDCLLRVEGRHEEVKSLLSELPMEKWNSSTHYVKKSYFSLYICDFESALRFANCALERNRDFPPALVNKALAYFIEGKQDDVDLCIKELNKEIYAEHHRAAAKALEGDITSMLILLQRSFVLDRYSAKDSCEDVVFRAYWEVPKFREAISRFSLNKSLEFPYLKTCPPSERELQLREKILKEVA